MEYLLCMLNVSSESEQKTHLIFMPLRQTVESLPVGGRSSQDAWPCCLNSFKSLELSKVCVCVNTKGLKILVFNKWFKRVSLFLPQIPRYILTLHELLAHTPHEHVERNSLDYAKSKLEELSRYINQPFEQLKIKNYDWQLNMLSIWI